MKTKQIKIIALVAAMLGVTGFWAHGAFAADSMPGMDHGSMGHESMQAVPGDQQSEGMSGMNHSARQGMDHSSGNHSGTMQGGAAPADARDPHAYADGYDFGPIPPPRMADQAYMGAVLFNRLERTRSGDSSFNAYDIQGWFGKDYERLVVKAEGDVAQGKLQDARTELLWGHAIASYWNAQLGVRHDGGAGQDRGWLAFGVQGLAPYWFELEVTAYAGDNGKTAFRMNAEYELMLTQKLILQPSAEINLHGKNDPARDIGSGLSDALAGLRLRYEFTRQFAPYMGIEWAGKFGETANMARVAGDKSSKARWLAGVRFWF